MDNPAGDAPWGINPSNGKPYTKSPEEREAIGQRLAEARRAKANAAAEAVAETVPDPADAQPIDRSAPDREPGSVKPRRLAGRRRRTAGGPKIPVDVPPFRAGPIAKGMNRLYVKTGRIIKACGGLVLGEAFISMTRKESDDDETVGETWEALAQVSPVWRARLLRLCSGGAAGRVLMAHLPILMAILAMEPVRKRMPFGHIVEAVFGGDEPAATGGPGEAGAEPSFDDMAAMVQMAAQFMPMMQRTTAPGVRIPVPSPDSAAGAFDFHVQFPDDGTFGTDKAAA